MQPELSPVDALLAAARTAIKNYRNPDCRFVDLEASIDALAKAVTVVELQPGEGGWIVWRGGYCPVPPETRVDLSRPDGIRLNQVAGHYVWHHHDNAQDITSFRYTRDTLTAPAAAVPALAPGEAASVISEVAAQLGLNRSTGMRCTFCCAKSGEPHDPACPDVES